MSRTENEETVSLLSDYSADISESEPLLPSESARTTSGNVTTPSGVRSSSIGSVPSIRTPSIDNVISNVTTPSVDRIRFQKTPSVGSVRSSSGGSDRSIRRRSSYASPSVNETEAGGEKEAENKHSGLSPPHKKKKKKRRRCPRFMRSLWKNLKKVWLSDTDQYAPLKSAVTFPAGMLLGYGFNQVIVTKFQLDKETYQITSAAVMFLMGVAFAFSVRIRCILSLVVPMFFGKGGRSYVSTFAVMYLISGPVANIIFNAKETAKMLTCMTHLLVNLTTNRFKLRTEPIKAGLKEIQSRGFYLKEIVANLDNAYRPIRDEIEDDSEVIELKDETEKVDEVVPPDDKKSRVEKIEERAYLGDEEGEIARYLEIERRWQRKLNYRCEGVFNRAVKRCRIWFSTGERYCMEMFSIFGYLLCLPLKLSVMCHIIRIVTGVLGLDCNSASVMDPGLGETYVAVRDMVAGLDKNFKVNMQYKIVNPQQDLNYMSAEHARKYTMNTFEEKARITKFVATLMKRILAFTFLIVFKNAFSYHKKWVSDYKFDNVYITEYFRHIDARRQAKGKRTLLPLKKIEEKALVYPWNPSLMSSEKKSFTSSSLLLLFRVFISGLLIFMDYLLFTVLDLISRHSRVDYRQKGEHKIKFTVFGTGYLQYVVRLFLESFNKHYRMDRTDTNVNCLPNPLQLSLYELSVIFSIYFVVWVLLYLEAYALRMRRVISAFYYRKIEKRRVLFLYNDLLKRRIGLLRHLRKKVRKLAKERKLSEKTGLLYSLKQQFPRVCGWLGYFSKSKSFCLICKTPEIPGNFVQCPTPGCNFGYCRQCWRDVKRRCYACMESYRSESEASTEESDYTDDDELFD